MRNDSMKEMVLQGLSVIRIENQMVQQIAIQHPRAGLKAILEKAFEELEVVPEYAEKNYYVIEYKKKANDPKSEKVKVEGLSIKAAMTLQRYWGNIMSGGQLIGEDDDYVYVQGAAVDLETNARVYRPSKVPKFFTDYDTGARRPLKDEKLRQAVQAEMSKMVRNCLLALLPEGLKIPYWKKAKEIAVNGVPVKGAPVVSPAQRFQEAVKRFKIWDVTAERLLAHLEVEKVEEVTMDMVGDLLGIYNGIVDKEQNVEDVFPRTKKETVTVGSTVVEGLGKSKEEEKKPEAPANVVAKESEEKTRPLPPDPRELAVKEVVVKMREVLPSLGTDKQKPEELEFSRTLLESCFGVKTWGEMKTLEPKVLSEGADKLNRYIEKVKASRAASTKGGA